MTAAHRFNWPAVAHSAARIQHDRDDVPDETGNPAGVVVWLAVSGLLSLALIVGLILWVALPRMAWPEACAGLSAAECTALLQEGG